MAEARTVETLQYNLSRELDLLAAEALKNDLLELLNSDGNLEISADDVERVSTPCIEVLVAASAAFGETGRGFHIRNPSDAFCDAFGALGLAHRLEMWRAS